MFPNHIDLIQRIWERSEGPYAFLPTKSSTGVWQETPVKLPLLGPEPRLIVPPPGVNCYFSPLRFFTSLRGNGTVGKPGVLFADLDHSDPRDITDGIRPTIAWETSPGSHQAIWYLDKPWEGPIETWRAVNQALTYYLHADKGGWMQSKVLRIPGTVNYKHSPAPVGRLLWEEDQVYALERSFFPMINTHFKPTGPISVPPVPSILPGWEDAQKILRKRWEDLTLSARYWLTVSEEQYLRRTRTDRSALIWDMAKALHKNKFTAEETYALIFNAPWCKWREAPYKLWEQIHRAQAS